MTEKEYLANEIHSLLAAIADSMGSLGEKITSPTSLMLILSVIFVSLVGVYLFGYKK